MPISVIGSSAPRNTDIGRMVEAFIDQNNEELSITVINMLETLAADIDEAAKEQNDKIEELESKVSELEGELAEHGN